MRGTGMYPSAGWTRLRMTSGRDEDRAASRRRVNARSCARTAAPSRTWLSLCACFAAAFAVLALTVPAVGRPLGARTAPPSGSAAAAAAHRAREARRHCQSGHVLLALSGPRVITPQRRVQYVVLARACGHALRRIRVSV